MRINKMRFHWVKPASRSLLLLLLVTGLLSPLAQADCMPQTAGVVMATPLSSRLDRVGDAIQAVLERALQLGNGTVLPSGTQLKGKVTAVKHGDPKGGPPGQLQFQLTQAETAQGVFPIMATPAVEGGWLRQQDANTAVWQVALNHSTRLLNNMIQRRLGTNQGVWAANLGITENVIPDVTTDEFIERYHRNNVLVGAGDRIYLRFACP